MIAGCVGNRAAVRLKHGWVEPAILWAALVGKSGSIKSVVLRLVTRPLVELFQMERDAFAEKMREYATELERHSVATSKWKSDQKTGPPTDPPVEPGEPREKRVLVSDATIEVATGCKDEIAARAVLTHLERRAELVRAGVLTPAEADAADHAGLPFSKHLDAYEKHLRAKSGDPRRISMLRRRLERLARDCRFFRLNKMSAGPIERWLVEQAELGLSASTRNSYRESLVCFGNWCRRTHRLTQNPFADVPRADAKADRRHQRRALTEVELRRLLRVARLRPLAEFGRKITQTQADPQRRPRSRATWKREPLTVENIDAAVERAREALKDNPDLIARRERTGYERALIYKTLVLTGLRKGELASLTVGQLDFAGPVAYAILNAADEKNRQGSNIPLRADVATELSS